MTDWEKAKETEMLIEKAISKAGDHKKLAEILGVTPSTVRQWAKPSLPTTQNMQKIWEYLYGVPL
jgi:DNA-binding transcriptional regulator YdaS (Cro superfamily)